MKNNHSNRVKIKASLILTRLLIIIAIIVILAGIILIVSDIIKIRGKTIATAAIISDISSSISICCSVSGVDLNTDTIKNGGTLVCNKLPDVFYPTASELGVSGVKYNGTTCATAKPSVKVELTGHPNNDCNYDPDNPDDTTWIVTKNSVISPCN